jgi:beta-glucanase (GH16 family)
MKKFSLLFAIFAGNYVFAQSPHKDSCWNLQWSDNFKTLTLQQVEDAGWIVADSFDHGGEPQVYMEGNVTIDSNGLVLEAKPETLTCYPCEETTHYYSSGQIASWEGFNGDHLPLFGYIETRMTVPDGFGMFPAFWIWFDGAIRHDESMTFEFVPESRETCDQFPCYSQLHDKNLLTTTLQWDYYNEVGCNHLLMQKQTLYINDYTVPHTYGIEWSPSKIIWYVDDIAIRNAPNPSPGPINHQSTIIINLALFDWVVASQNYDNASYAYNFSTNNINYFPSSPYSEKMIIEYVNYYQLDTSTATSDLTMTSGNISSYDDKVKKTITTSGAISIPFPYIHNAWRAAEYIYINAGLTVPIGSELYIDANPTH